MARNILLLLLMMSSVITQHFILAWQQNPRWIRSTLTVNGLLLFHNGVHLEMKVSSCNLTPATPLLMISIQTFPNDYLKWKTNPFISTQSLIDIGETVLENCLLNVKNNAHICKYASGEGTVGILKVIIYKFCISHSCFIVSQILDGGSRTHDLL